MLKIGMVGAGRIGKLHANTIMTLVPGATLVSIADFNQTAAQSLAAEYDIKHATGSFQELLKQPDVEAVLIASSTNTHSQFMIEAAQAGKHIFCEKPIDYNLARIDAALKAVADAGVKLQIGFNRRFDASFSRIKHAIVSGEIGTPHLLNITSRDPGPPPIDYIKVSGGLLYDMTIHDFDMAHFLFGEVDEIYAAAGNLVDPAIGEAGDIDTAVITLKFTSGAMGVITNSRKAVYGYDQRAEAFGSNGSAQSENMYPNLVTISGADNVRRADLPLNFFIERYTPSFQMELQAFVECVTNNTPSPVSGHDGRVPVVMAMAAYQSLKENRAIKLSEIG